MANATDFDSWWNNQYFQTQGQFEPLYKCFRKLHDRGLDLYRIKEIDVLGGCTIPLSRADRVIK